MAWTITHDLINDADDEFCRKGKTVGGPLQGETFTFKLLDDDLEHYFTGTADEAAWDDDDSIDGLYGAYQWAMADTGCTHLIVSLETLERIDGAPSRMEIYRKIAFPTGPYKGWVTIYS